MSDESNILVSFERELGAALTSREALLSLAEKIGMQIEKLQDQYVKKSAKAGEVKPAAFAQFMEKYYASLQSILIKNTEKALETSREFSYAPFAERLILAVSEPAVLEITTDLVSTEENPSIIVNINMDAVAGTIEQYAAAIKSVRDEGMGGAFIKSGAPEVGSKVFYEKYYMVDREGGKVTRTYKGKRRIDRVYDKNGKYIKKSRATRNYKTEHSASGPTDITEKYKGKYTAMVAARLSAMGSIAPFWSLLEYGNANVKMASSEGGSTKRLTQRPTNFVSNSKKQAQEQGSINFRSVYKEMKKQFDSELESISDLIVKLQELLVRIDKYIMEFDSKAALLFREFKGDPEALANGAQFFANDIQSRYAGMGKPITKPGFQEAMTRTIENMASGRAPLNMRPTLPDYGRFRLNAEVKKYILSRR
jgi:hypothetical protein